MTIYLDLDGVLANFDKRAMGILNECHYRYDFIHGGDALWSRLHGTKDFFAGMEKMPRACLLIKALQGADGKLRSDAVVLTALPSTGAEDTDRQKREWCENHLGEEVVVVTCKTKEKPLYCQPGDILIDDRTVNREAWEAAGGYFIWHKDAEMDTTLAILRTLKVIA